MATEPLAPLVHYIRTIAAVARDEGEPSDGLLLSRFARHRDEAAFAALVHRHGPMVLGVCQRVARDWHAAEDAFQATFLVLAQKAGNLTQPELLGHWLHGVAYRTASKARIGTVRRRAREQEWTAPRVHDPSEEFLRREVCTVVDEEVDRLPTRYRVAVVLCYLQGRTNSEAARQLGCSRGTVATLLARARDRLRRRLTQRGLVLSAGLLTTVLMEQARGCGVRFGLERMSAQAAAAVAAGQVQAAGVIGGRAAALAEGVAKNMLAKKLNITAAILLATLVAASGVGIVAYRARAQEPDVTEAKRNPAPPAPTKRENQPPTPPGNAKEVCFRSANFLVTAPTEEIARRVAKAAEANRKALALLWLGRELLDWTEPCPVLVKVEDKGPSSSSTFAFQKGAVSLGGMHLEGSFDEVLADLLPHEMTHTILASGRKRAMPRWADEGAATLSESAAARAGYEEKTRKLLRAERRLPLRELLSKLDYPKEIMTFYVQSYALTDYLVGRGGRAEFLAFVARGEREGWDKAGQTSYGFRTVEDLERAWLEHLRKRLPQPAARPKEDKTISSTGSETAVTSKRKEPLPAGPAPVQAWVTLGKDGRLSVRRMGLVYQPVAMGKDRENRPLASYQLVTSETTETYQRDAIQVFDMKGRPIDSQDLPFLLKGETLVLASADGHEVDPLHLRLHKSDTLLIILPSPTPPPARPAQPPPIPIPGQGRN